MSIDFRNPYILVSLWTVDRPCLTLSGAVITRHESGSRTLSLAAQVPRRLPNTLIYFHIGHRGMKKYIGIFGWSMCGCKILKCCAVVWSLKALSATDGLGPLVCRGPIPAVLSLLIMETGGGPTACSLCVRRLTCTARNMRSHPFRLEFRPRMLVPFLLRIRVVLFWCFVVSECLCFNPFTWNSAPSTLFRFGDESSPNRGRNSRTEISCCICMS